MRPAILGILAAAVAAWMGPVEACSMQYGYRVPNNLELVEQADAIVLVRVVDGPTDHDPDDPAFSAGLQVELVRALKGSVPAERLRLFGLVAWNGEPVPAIVTPLSEAHFSVGLGACIRQFYAPGELVVAMFEKGEEGIQPAFHAFARTFESVTGPDDIWVHAIERYLVLANGPAATRRARIEAERMRQAALGTTEGAAIAADLEAALDAEGRQAEDVARGFNAPAEAAMFLPSGEGKGVALVCTRGVPSRLIWPGDLGARVTLGIGDARFEAAPARLDPSSEQREADAAAVSAAIEDPHAMLAALRSATGTIDVRDQNRVLASARAADVALRFADRCSGFAGEARGTADDG